MEPEDCNLQNCRIRSRQRVGFAADVDLTRTGRRVRYCTSATRSHPARSLEERRVATLHNSGSTVKSPKTFLQWKANAKVL
jgi:hypothetical protein